MGPPKRDKVVYEPLNKLVISTICLVITLVMNQPSKRLGGPLLVLTSPPQVSIGLLLSGSFLTLFSSSALGLLSAEGAKQLGDGSKDNHQRSS